MSRLLPEIVGATIRAMVVRLSTRRVRRAAVATLLLAPLALWASTWLPVGVPSYEQVRERHRASAAFLLDRHGVRIDSTRRDHGERRGAWRPLAEISPAVVDALIAGEDQRFRSHGGVDPLALAGALRDRVLGRNQRGASTLTMQLATLLIDRPRPRGTLAALGRKWLQMRTAHAIERDWSKEQILEAYLNRVGLRGEVVGIDAAAEIFADTAADALYADRSAVLVALLPDPNATPARVAERACTRRRARQPKADCAPLAALADAMFARRAAASEPHLAPQLAEKLLKDAGSSRRSTLDAHWQAFARDALANQLARLAERNVRDGAVLVVDNRDGAVLAYVGSAGPKSNAPTLDGVAARRQAGSTLKPFLYELAIEQGLITAASLLDDSPIHLDTASGTYIPQDYDREFKGMVSARTALASSLNVPAVRTLVLTGVEPFRSRLVDLGYTGIDRGGDFYGYSLALGSAEVSLWEQAGAYARLARGGRPLRLHVIADEDEPAEPPTSAPPWATAAQASSPGKSDPDVPALSSMSRLFGVSSTSGKLPAFGVSSTSTSASWVSSTTAISSSISGIAAAFGVRSGSWVSSISQSGSWVSSISSPSASWVPSTSAISSSISGIASDFGVRSASWVSSISWVSSTASTAEASATSAPYLRSTGPSSTVTPASAAALALDPAASFVVADILADRAARGLTFGLGNALETPFWSAAKTGTSKDMRDNWCIGFSERYTVAVWVGNFEGDAMREVSGVTGAAPVWQQLMLALHGADAPAAPAAPSGVIAREVTFRPALESPRREWFLTGSELPTVDASLGTTRRARIEAPGNGMVIALDPDVPEPRQRVALSAEGDVRGMHFELDEQPLGDADQMQLWKPAAGAHRLVLVDRTGKVTDRILFTVR